MSDTANKPVEHPAKFSPNVLQMMRMVLSKEANVISKGGIKLPDRVNVLDPFGGVGGIHLLTTMLTARPIETWCIELEVEWADQARQRGWTWCGDFFAYQPTDDPAMRFRWLETTTKRAPKLFDVIATSPTYGNRMADHHNARDASKRITYKHKLGRDLTDNNSGMMHFGEEYKAFHVLAYRKFAKLLKPGGLVLLNVSDFIRGGALVEASAWHHKIMSMHFLPVKTYNIPTARMGFGQNGKARVEFEQLHVFVRP